MIQHTIEPYANSSDGMIGCTVVVPTIQGEYTSTFCSTKEVWEKIGDDVMAKELPELLEEVSSDPDLVGFPVEGDRPNQESSQSSAASDE